MFKPVYTLNFDIIKNLNKIERLYGHLEALRLPKKLIVNLERENLIQSSYASNSIEGNPLSKPEVTNLLLEARVAVNRDEQEVKNYYDLLNDLSGLERKTIDLNLVKYLHEQLLKNVDDKIAGQVRNKKIVVGKRISSNEIKIKHTPPYHQRSEIEAELQDLFIWLRENELPPILQAGLFHHQYLYLHPFVDGNGRTCRLLTALIFLQNHYEINKYFVLDDYYDLNRHDYSNKLHSADHGDSTIWLEYFTQGVKYALTSALEKAKKAVKTIKVEFRPTPKEEEVLAYLQTYRQITSTDLAEHLGVSRQQAYNLLSSLLEKKFIVKKGRTKGSYYHLR